MKKFTDKIFVVVIAGTFSASASATCQATHCTSKIQKLFPHANSSVYISPEEPMTAVNCSDTKFTLKQTNANFDAIYSMLLTAISTDKVVRLRVVDGTADCELSYAWIDTSEQ